MKYSTTTLLSILCSAALSVKAEGPCVQNTDSFEINGCDYDNFVEGLEEFLDGETTCDHGAKTELRHIYSTTDNAKQAISQACSSAWNSVPTSSFSEFQSFSRTLRNQTFILAILDNLKKVFGFSHDPGSQLYHTKPYYTKPRHFRSIIFRAKVPKSKWV